jgi:hypothetical protein
MTAQLTLFGDDVAVDDKVHVAQLPLPTAPAEPAPQGGLHVGDVFTYQDREYELLEIRAPLDEDDGGSLIASDRENFLHMRRVIYDIARFEELSGYTVALEEAT